jgi:hypothetical protein
MWNRSFLAALLLYPAVAGAQPVQQSGSVTPGHVPIWVTNGVLGDGGTAAQGNLTSLGITASGPSFCINSDLVTAAGWQQFCFGVTTSGGGTISLQNFGTAPAESFAITINGTAYQFPFTTTGVVGPNSSVIGNFSQWNNTSGTLLKDAGFTTGTSGHAIPFLDGANTWSATQTFAGINATSIGGIPGTGAFTTLSASSTVSGTGFSTYLASPPAIGGTAPGAGAFTTLSASSTVSGAGFSAYLASPPAIGGSAAAAGTFTSLGLNGSGSGTVSILPQAAAGTYNFNLPTTAGATGQFLTSAGGVGAPMTWTTPPTTLSQLFVNHATGSDSNTCLTALVPCATIQHAYTIFQSNYCSAGAVTITNANETFTEQVALRGTPCMNGGYQAFIQCPAGCLWQIGNNQIALSVRDFAEATVSGITFNSTGTTGTIFLNPTQFGIIDAAANIIYGANTGGVDIQVSQGGSFNCDSTGYTVQGSGRASHIFMQGASNLQCASQSVIVGAMTVTTAWLTIQGTSTAVMSGWVCSSGAGCGAGTTGSKYNITLNGVAITAGATFPGASAGTTGTGGQFN